MKSPFRSIRQTLFNEGKLLRYLGYAIGEVVLIIVGILFALKINDWNEDKKAQVEFDEYVVQLKMDVQKAIDLNQDVHDYSIRRSEEIVFVIEFLEGSDRPPVALSEFENYLNQIGYYIQIQLNVGLLGELLNGKTDTINRDPLLHQASMDTVSKLLDDKEVVTHVTRSIDEHRNQLVKFIAPKNRFVPRLEQKYDLGELRASKEFKYLAQNIARRHGNIISNSQTIVSDLQDFLTVLEEYE